MKRLFYVLLVVCGLVTVISSCHKHTTTAPPSPPAGALLLHSNVHIIDSTQWILHGSASDGIYKFSFTPNTPNIDVKAGDIIVGTTNGGYIRKVTSTSVSGSLFVLQTSQATMADVFKSGQFTLQVPMNDPNQSNPGIYRSFSNYSLYHSSNYDVKLLSGSFDIEPTWNVSFAFDSTGLTNFEMSASNTSFRDSLLISSTGVVSYLWGNNSTLASITTSSIQYVTTYDSIRVPVVIQLTLNLIANLKGIAPNWMGPANTQTSWIGGSVFTGGLQYTAGQWQPFHSNVSTNAVDIDSGGYSAALNSTFTFLSQISSQFYSVAGPQVTIGISGDIIGTNRFAPDYTRRTDLWTTSSDAQPVPPVFGRNIGTFTQTWNSDSVFYQTPFLTQKIHGDAQTGNIVQTLPEPLIVQVTDSRGAPVQGIRVNFAPQQGGSVNNSTSAINVITDQNGKAQVTWSLGIPQGTQTVTVKVVDGNQVSINGSPAIFTCTAQ